MNPRFDATDAPVFEGVRNGEVVEFNEHAGLGYVRSDEGDVYLLHCIAIADGSRTVEAGQRIGFRTSVKFGRAEATDVVKI